MDVLGFGLETFDKIGRWREQDRKVVIDFSEIPPGGDRFRGSTDLLEVVMVVASGRGLTPTDRCAADRIVKSAEQD